MSEFEKKNPGPKSGFYDWFSQYKIDTIACGMLKSGWEEAGLGVPPPIFMMNACESVNVRLKRKVLSKKSELSSFVKRLVGRYSQYPTSIH